jgi:DNA-binding beta-propeller fold protein YncE
MSIVRRSILAVLVTLGGSLALWSAPALATPDYGLTGSFGLGVDKTPPGGNVCTVASGEECGPGTAGSGTGQFKEPAGIAVNQSTGDVYVVDQGNNRVQEFDAEGNPVDFTAGPGTGTNVLSGTGTEIFSLSGFASSYGDPDSANGIAVDNSCYYHGLLPTATACKTSYPSNGDVYVIDTGHNVIDKFNEAGDYIGQLTGTGPPGSIVPFAGTPLFGVAVDEEGKVWVYESGKEVLSCSNALVNECSAQWAVGFGTSPGFAVDSADNVYVLKGFPDVEKFSGAGVDEGRLLECEPASPGTCGEGLAVDGSNDLYVAEGTKVAEYGAPVEPGISLPIHEFGEERLANGTGIAVSAAGAVYVADYVNDDVDIFELGEPPVEAPITEPASPPTATTALLHGTLMPAATKVRYRFEYNTGASCVGVGGVKTVPKESEGSVSEEVKGLQPDTPYTFCLVAENAYGRLSGLGESFTTPPAVAGVSKCTASGVTGEAATLQASLEPLGTLTEYHFQYGTSLPGSKTKVKSSALSVGVETDSEPVAELEPNRSYECRLLATREIEGKPYTTEGEIGTFTTSVVPPLAAGEPASFVGARAATLVAKVDPENSATSFHFEYGETAAYGQQTPDEAVGSGINASYVAQRIEGLAVGATYHFRVVATNEQSMTTYGPDETFTTGAENKPGVQTGAASDVTRTGASISGTVDPEGAQTSYAFEVGTDTSYSGVKVFGDAGQGGGAEPIAVAVQDLAPGTTYHYRLTATNAHGTSYGQDMTFTTAGAPSPITQPLTAPLIATPTIAFPTGSQENTGTTETKKLTRAQKLANALKACQKKPKSKRASCKKQADKRYGPAKKAKKK